MAQQVLRVGDLPVAPLDAAAAFHALWLAQARALSAQHDVALIFAPADHTHDAWRLASVQELAREAAPRRVNAVAGDEEPALAEVLDYLAGAPGITGQLLPVAGKTVKMD